MKQLFRFEFGKLIHKKLILAAIAAYTLVMIILLLNQRIDYLEVKTADGTTYHGRKAAAYEKTIADKYRGELNADKVNDILKAAIDSGSPEELSYKGDWVTKSISSMFVWESWDKVKHLTEEDIESAYPQIKEQPFQIGYTRGWETAMLCMESMLLIAGFLIVITVAPVFSEEYSSGMDALLLTAKKGKSTCIRAKITASVCFSVLLALFTIALPAGAIFIQYGIKGWDATVQAAAHGLFWTVPRTLSCLQAMILVIIFAVIGAVLLTCITLLISALSKNAFTAVLVALLLYIVPIVLIDKLDILPLNQFLSIMPSGDFNAALVLGMEDMRLGGLRIPMSYLNIFLTAVMGLTAWKGCRNIFGGHQVT